MWEWTQQETLYAPRETNSPSSDGSALLSRSSRRGERVAAGSPWPCPPFPAACPFRLPIPSTLPPPLTDPDVQISRIRLFRAWSRPLQCLMDRIATRRSCVEMSVEFEVSDILPSCGSMTRHPLPSPGSQRMTVPRFPWYYGMLRPPDTRPLPLVALRKGTAPWWRYPVLLGSWATLSHACPGLRSRRNPVDQALTIPGCCLP